jgi:hypothetical protein
MPREHVSDWLVAYTFRRWELFILPCSLYEPDWYHRILLAFHWLPVLTYSFISFVTVWDRTTFVMTFWMGFLTNNFLIFLSEYSLADVRNDWAVCAERTYDLPSEEASVLWFAATFCAMYDMLYPTHGITRSVLRVAFLCVYAVAPCYAMFQLHLYDSNEIAYGITVGVFTGMLMVLLTELLFRPYFKHPVMRWLRSVLGIAQDRYG